jgi:hypothetical protein
MRVAFLFQNKKQSYIKIKVYLNSKIIIVELNSSLIQILAALSRGSCGVAGMAAGFGWFLARNAPGVRRREPPCASPGMRLTF